MKKMFFALLIGSLLIITANAQTEKGDCMVGGGFRLNTSKNNTEIAFTPNVGFFIINDLALGGNLVLDYTKSGDNKFTSFGIGPFARYCFPGVKVRPILQANFNYLSTKSKIGTNASSTNTGINYFLGGGAAIFISDQVSLDFLMGYDHTKYKDFDGSGGFALTIGFQVYLHKRQVESLGGK